MTPHDYDAANQMAAVPPIERFERFVTLNSDVLDEVVLATLDVEQPHLWIRWIRTRLRMGDLRAALAIVREARERGPHDARAVQVLNEQLIAAYRNNGLAYAQRNEALRELAECRAAPSARVSYQMVDAALDVQRCDDCLGDMEGDSSACRECVRRMVEAAIVAARVGT